MVTIYGHVCEVLSLKNGITFLILHIVAAKTRFELFTRNKPKKAIQHVISAIRPLSLCQQLQRDIDLTWVNL